MTHLHADELHDARVRRAWRKLLREMRRDNGERE